MGSSDSSIIRRRRAIFGSTAAMYVWPPKPGLTVMTSTRSITVEHVRDQLGGVVRVEGDAAARAERRGCGQRAVQVGAGLGVHDDQLAAGLDIPSARSRRGRRP